MRTIKILLALAVIVTFTTGVVAQEKQQRKGRRVKLNPASQAMLRIQRLHTELKKIDLSEEQQAKLKKVHDAAGPEMMSAMEQVTEILGEESMKEVKEVAQKAQEAGKTPWQVAVAIEAALTLNDEQTEKLAKVGKELMAIQRGMMKEVNGILTAEQKEKLKAQMAPKKRGNRKSNKKNN